MDDFHLFFNNGRCEIIQTYYCQNLGTMHAFFTKSLCHVMVYPYASETPNPKLSCY